MNPLLALEDLEAHLASMTRAQLHEMLLALLKRDPALLGQFAEEATRFALPPPVAATAPMRVDAVAVRAALTDNWPRALDTLLAEGATYVRAGEGENALALLAALTPIHVQNWLRDKDANSCFDELGELWTEALLSVELDKTARVHWRNDLEQWDSLMAEHGGAYGFDETFQTALAALEHGWDYAPLQQVLRGQPPSSWEGEAPWCGAALAQARLRVLARQGRYVEYLRLALAEKQIGAYVLMLLQRGYIGEAVEAALARMNDSRTAYQIAQALYQQGKISDSLRVAEQGLGFEDFHLARLARWLYEIASKHQRLPLALKAGAIACRLRPNLSLYRRLQSQAKESWAQMRTALLAAFCADESAMLAGAVEILHYEGHTSDEWRVRLD
jgi:hypothetical protein